jgi:class 3 adenylate cyclase
MFRKIIDYYIPTLVNQTEEVHRRYKLIVSTIIITILFELSYFGLCILMNFREGMFILLVTSLLLFLILYLIKKRLNMILATNLYVMLGVVNITVCIYYSGGFHSPVLPWLASSPIVALLLGGKRTGFLWVMVNSLLVIIAGLLQVNGYSFPRHYNAAYTNLFYIDCFVGLVLIIFLVAIVFENGKNAALDKLAEKNNLLEAEKQKSDELLLNILPAEISKELKETGKTKAYSYDVATVMFADFVDFTKIGERLSPEDLVFAIGEYFETFDRIIEKYGIEKIKTVGDAYICAAGLPIPTTDNAIIMIKVAIDFMKAIKQLNDRRENLGGVTFNIRIGVNTGPLVAGVVGIKKFAYDIWGDTVNTAARLQENGAAGKINISESTYELINTYFHCTYRGKIQAKNKGEIDMYFVEGTKANVGV